MIGITKATSRVGEVTGDTDIDIDQADYTAFQNVLTVTAPSTGLIDCRIDIDVNKTTTGWDAGATASDVFDIALVGQTDGTNYRTLQNATQIAAQGDESLESSESGASFHVGPMQANASLQVHVRMDAERAVDVELPYRVTYIGRPPTVTPVAAA
jgi:hypothetical protein